jgi:hypothetical protein
VPEETSSLKQSGSTQPTSQHASHASATAAAPTIQPALNQQTVAAESPRPTSSDNPRGQHTTVSADAAVPQIALSTPASNTGAPLPLLTMPGIAQNPSPDLSNVGSYQAPAVSPDSLSLYQQAAADPGLAVTVLPHAAHLSLVSNAGDLSLHVRVRDGNADVNVGGSMAPMFDSKAPEMRTVLATQGLGLGSFATDQQGGQQSSQQRPEPASAEPPAPSHTPARRAPAAAESAIVDEGRIHITA